MAFAHIDRRLAAWLLARADAGHVTATHQSIADELGTAREVVSRLLKELERQGLVRLTRGEVTTSDGRHCGSLPRMTEPVTVIQVTDGGHAKVFNSGVAGRQAGRLYAVREEDTS